MKRRSIAFSGIAAACAMLVLILDTKTAVFAARDGVQLCIRTVIPSLFPFFVLSGIINSSLLGHRLGILRPLGKFCKIPVGSESLLILGLIAGYPVGAQLITQAYKQGNLTKRSAVQMMGFCSNAGPAFIFGMLTPMFKDNATVWLLWGIHIITALITARILPYDERGECKIEVNSDITLTHALHLAIKTMAAVCGWIVVFRVTLGFCSRWFLWLLPFELQILVSGLTELANGCMMLQQLPQEGMRFILASTMLAFGGLCVGMQTMSVSEGLGTGLYFPGKVLQTVLSFFLSGFIQLLIFDKADAVRLPVMTLAVAAIFILIGVIAVRRKKVVAFQGELLYNTSN